MKTITLLLSFLFIFSGLKAQTVSVTEVVQDGQKLIVSYDITGGTGNYEVSLFCSTDDGTTWAGPLKSVSGDAGKNVSAGIGKKITWMVLNDRAALDGDKIRFKVKANKDENTVTDIDGNTYQTVKIGSQIWMKENLKTSRYRNGDGISTGLRDNEWGNTTMGAYSVYNNNLENNRIFGKLYNWYAVSDNRNLCPAGWHVPRDSEWNTLVNFLGKGNEGVGGKMKLDSGLWIPPNIGATNSSGFSGLPSGFRYDNGKYDDLGKYCYWWFYNQNSSDYAPNICLQSNLENIIQYNFVKQSGLSVRCIKD
jgi:uncharacterized protein (TIGR02145 family)